jgi:putative NADPH-quinone reductase
MFGALSHLSSALRAPHLPAKRVLVVNGHPDPGAGRYCAALCAAYAEGAQSSGYATQRLDVGAVTLPGAESGRPFWLRNDAAEVLERLWLADRLFIAFPMWLGGPPPALQLILEEFTRWQKAEAAQLGEPIEVKEAHVVVTANFPGLIYRTSRGASVGAWATALAGLHVAQHILIGSMGSNSPEERIRWLSEVRRLGGSRLSCVAERMALG